MQFLYWPIRLVFQLNWQVTNFSKHHSIRRSVYHCLVSSQIFPITLYLDYQPNIALCIHGLSKDLLDLPIRYLNLPASLGMICCHHFMSYPALCLQTMNGVTTITLRVPNLLKICFLINMITTLESFVCNATASTYLDTYSTVSRMYGLSWDNENVPINLSPISEISNCKMLLNRILYFLKMVTILSQTKQPLQIR